MEIKAQKDQFDYIYRVYYKQLFIFAKRYVAEDEDCCDLVGDVFEYLWAHFDSVNLPGAVVPLHHSQGEMHQPPAPQKDGAEIHRLCHGELAEI